MINSEMLKKYIKRYVYKMFTAKEFVKVKSLEEAWELNQRRSNKIIGGMMWLKMSTSHLNKLIDMSELGLGTIEETDEEFIIGCLTPLRDLELHIGLDSYSCGSVKEALHSIVGVQFRNLATVGGSIFGRYGFSDVISVFMSMDSYVELYKGGIVPLSEFVNMKHDNDILVRLIVKKTPMKFHYYSVRNTRTDFPVLTCAAATDGNKIRIAVGARPAKATIFEKNLSDCKDAESFALEAAEKIETGSNMRAKAEYRTHLVKVLAKRAYEGFGGVK